MKKNLENNKSNNCEGKIFFDTKTFPFFTAFNISCLLFFLCNPHAAATLVKNYITTFYCANSMYIDIALWNYFKRQEKRRYLVIESAIAALIVYWVT
jgi:hypothetical protein